jgi:hypothetical protein
MFANLDIITFHPFVVPKEFLSVSFQIFQVPQKLVSEPNSQSCKTASLAPADYQNTLSQPYMMSGGRIYPAGYKQESAVME